MKRDIIKVSYLFVVFVLIGLLWWRHTPVRPKLLYEVNTLYVIPFLESPFLYFYLLGGTILFPLLYSFEKRIAYFTKWKYLFLSAFLVAIPFIGWDVFFTKRQAWGFNPAYFSGITILNLPIEEWLFFFCIPFSCVFIYESFNFFVKKNLQTRAEPLITVFLIIGLFLIGVCSLDKLYTATTFLLTAAGLLFHFLFISDNYRIRFYLAYLITCIPFLIINGALTGAFTAEPVVVYNPLEQLDVRIVTIPVEDAVYSFLLLLGNISLFEFFKKNQKNSDLVNNQYDKINKGEYKVF